MPNDTKQDNDDDGLFAVLPSHSKKGAYDKIKNFLSFFFMENDYLYGARMTRQATEDFSSYVANTSKYLYALGMLLIGASVAFVLLNPFGLTLVAASASALVTVLAGAIVVSVLHNMYVAIFEAYNISAFRQIEAADNLYEHLIRADHMLTNLKNPGFSKYPVDTTYAKARRFHEKIKEMLEQYRNIKNESKMNLYHGQNDVHEVLSDDVKSLNQWMIDVNNHIIDVSSYDYNVFTDEKHPMCLPEETQMLNELTYLGTAYHVIARLLAPINILLLNIPKSILALFPKNLMLIRHEMRPGYHDILHDGKIANIDTYHEHQELYHDDKYTYLCEMLATVDPVYIHTANKSVNHLRLDAFKNLSRDSQYEELYKSRVTKLHQHIFLGQFSFFHQDNNLTRTELGKAYDNLHQFLSSNEYRSQAQPERLNKCLNDLEHQVNKLLPKSTKVGDLSKSTQRMPELHPSQSTSDNLPKPRRRNNRRNQNRIKGYNRK